VAEKDVDPRFDPAFQRGFEGRVDARPEQQNVFARPDEPRRARRAAPVVGDAATIERALGAVVPAPVPPRVVEPRVVEARVPERRAEDPRILESREPQAVEDEPGQEAPEPVPGALVPLRSNPWFLGMLGLGAALSIAGYALLYWALATPLASFTGSADSTNAYVLHQMAFYISVPLLAGLPIAALLALALLAARWRGRAS
jgi:hypothetical protein